MKTKDTTTGPIKKVQFKQDKLKTNRLEALSDLFEKPITGILQATTLLIVWGDKDEIPKVASFIFGVLAVCLILLSIVRPLAIVKKLKLENALSIGLSILQGVFVGLAVAFYQERAAIPILTCNLLAGGLPHPYTTLPVRLISGLVVASLHSISIPMRIAALIAISDIGILCWNKYLEWKKEKKIKSKINSTRK